MPKIVDHDERRAEVAAAVWRSIAENGVEGATMRSIAREGGFSTGVLAHYFADKDALLLFALREATARTTARMLDRARRRPTAEALRAVALEALPLDDERRAEWLVWVAFWSRATVDERLRSEHAVRYDAYRSGVAELVRTGIADGSLRPDLDADVTTEDLICSLDGLGLQSVFEPDRLTRRRVTARADALIERLRA